MKKLIGCGLAVLLAGAASAQQTRNLPPTTVTKKMDTNLITNSTAKAALDAWQKGDAPLFLSFFAPDAALFDDGNPRNFAGFVREACGHERFASIDKVEDNGLSVYGRFHTEKWGDFKTYFKFHLRPDGKFSRLDIGQASY